MKTKHEIFLQRNRFLIFLFRKFCLSYILDLAKTVWALRIWILSAIRYSFGKIQNVGETELSEEKNLCFTGERFHVLFSYLFFRVCDLCDHQKIAYFSIQIYFRTVFLRQCMCVCSYISQYKLPDKTENAIYMMECIICNLQYVGKNETPFNIRLNNHRKDVKDPKGNLGDKHTSKK